MVSIEYQGHTLKQTQTRIFYVCIPVDAVILMIVIQIMQVN